MSIDRPHHLRAAGFVPLLLACVLTRAAPGNPYGEQFLRNNLGVEPYFRTEDGRANKRHAAAQVNSYRLYDFYRRQADFHRGTAITEPVVLPPFPGLDGGRRGHWGVTNEKSTTANPRPVEPAFPQVLSRGGSGELVVQSGGGALVIDTLRPGLRRAVAAAKLAVPEHAFGLGADRFGLELRMDGVPVFESAAVEWSAGGKPLSRFAGYAFAGGGTVLKWAGENAGLFDRPAFHVLPGNAGHAVSRGFEWRVAPRGAVELTLPRGVGMPEAAPELLAGPAGTTRLRIRGGERSVLHQLRLPAGAGCEVMAGGILKVQAVKAGDRFELLSWCGPAAAEGPAAQWLAAWKAAPPAGAAPRLGEEVIVAGRLNADPEAAGTAYEIDDVPLPGGPHAMTLSGLAFHDDGTAYACTLVGDVWQIRGLYGDLREVRWKRVAAGLDLPLGIEVVDGVPHVNARHHLLRLLDSDNDGEVERFEAVNRVPLGNNPACGRDLRRDAAGNFIFNSPGGIHRLSADGSKFERIGGGARNPLGLAVRGDGLVLSDSSEGNEGNGTCTIFESDHPENQGSVAKRKRLIYLPRGVDNSPGSRVFLDEPRFGPLGKAILGTSFGTGGWYALLRDVVDGTPQAALLPQAGLFDSGACRIAVQPLDGQLFVAGLDGWGDYAVADGCLHRVRHTGKTTTQVTGWRAHRNGIRLDFNGELAAGSITSASCFVQQWNYRDTAETYGSPEFSVRHPERIGHDRLPVAAVRLLEGGRSMLLEIPDLLPAMCTQVRATFTDAAGRPVEVDFYATLQRLADDAPQGRPTTPERPRVLVVPEAQRQGDTNQMLVEHFDRLAGREIASRPVAAEVTWKPEELNEAWIRQHLIGPHCLVCHGPGTQHDYSTSIGLRAKIRLEAPASSPLYGMVHTGSMPPYPLPAIPAGLRDALLEWIRRGAP
jgi:hypothetical protein